MKQVFRIINVGTMLLSCCGLIGCDTKAGTGAIVGGAGGALVGGIIGSKSHSRAGAGALIGGAAGAAGGALVGHAMDEQDKKDARRDDRDYDQQVGSPAPWQEKVTISDVVDWSRQGLHDDVIIDRIQRSRTVFYLSAADKNDLRDRGVSEDVIRAMNQTARR